MSEQNPIKPEEQFSVTKSRLEIASKVLAEEEKRVKEEQELNIVKKQEAISAIGAPIKLKPDTDTSTTLGWLDVTPHPPKCSTRKTTVTKDQHMSPDGKIIDNNEDQVVEIGDGEHKQRIEICEDEFEKYLTQQKIGERHGHLEAYKEAVKMKAFEASMIQEIGGFRAGGDVCLGFTVRFMRKSKQFLQDNAGSICNNPVYFFAMMLRKVLDEYEDEILTDSAARFVYNLLVKQVNVIPLILAICIGPVLPLCIFGGIQIIMQVIIIVLGLVTDQLCSYQRLDVKNAIRDVLKFLHLYRPDLVKKYYPRETIEKMMLRYNNLKEKVKASYRTLKRKAYNFKEGVKTRASTLKNFAVRKFRNTRQFFSSQPQYSPLGPEQSVLGPEKPVSFTPPSAEFKPVLGPERMRRRTRKHR